MGNPATELADLLERWRVTEKNQTLYSVRGDAEGASRNDLDFWRAVTRNLRKVTAYEEAVNALERAGKPADHYRYHLHQIYVWLFAPDLQWSAQQGAVQSNADPAAITSLRLAADAMDMVGMSDLSDEGIQLIQDRLREVREHVIGLPDSIDQQHLLWQIDQAIRFANQPGRFGDAAVKDLTAQVVVGMASYMDAQSVDEETRGFFNKVGQEILVTITSDGFSRLLTLGLGVASGQALELLAGA